MSIHLPLYFAPGRSYFKRISDGDMIFLNNELEFDGDAQKSRIDIASDKGAQSIRIPLVKETRKNPYDSVRISYAENWQKKMVNAIRTCYGSSPYYEYYDYLFEPIILRKYEFLWNLNADMLSMILTCLKTSQVSLCKTKEASDAFSPEIISGLKPYYQPFKDKIGFIDHLSILDLLFNEGPDAGAFL